MKYTITLFLILLLGAALAPPGSLAAKSPAVIPAGEAGQELRLHDLNTVDREDLLGIKGIGPALAERILAYRTRIGSFTSLDELLGVKGIGEKNLRRFKVHFTLTAPPSPVANSTPASP